MFKNTLLSAFLFFSFNSYSQLTLPIDFESGTVTTENFTDFDGGIGSVVDNLYSDSENESLQVGKIIRDGGQIWAGSYLVLDNNLDFTTNTTITMKVYSVSPGLHVKFKLENNGGAATERDAYTSTYNQWETLTWSFAGEPTNTYERLVLMFDFGNIGNGTDSSTFYFDEIDQTDPSGGLSQIDLPVTFDDSTVYYSLTDFEGNGPSTIEETSSGNFARVEKNSSSGTSAGVTIGNESGFATAIPASSSDSKMYVHAYVTSETGSANTGIPIRLKIENSNDPTQSVETEAYTTLVDTWEVLEFDFNNGTNPPTAEINSGYTYNKASLFFDFGSSGDDNTVYFFDNLSFSSPISLSTESFSTDSFKLYPNPVDNHLNIKAVAGVVKNIDIYNILGKKVYSSGPESKIDMKPYSEGIYFVKINNVTYKIIKN